MTPPWDYLTGFLCRACCGSVIRSFGGTTLHPNLITCSKLFFKGSSSTTNVAGKSKLPHSLLSFKNDWQLGMAFKSTQLFWNASLSTFVFLYSPLLSLIKILIASIIMSLAFGSIRSIVSLNFQVVVAFSAFSR